MAAGRLLAVLVGALALAASSLAPAQPDHTADGGLQSAARLPLPDDWAASDGRVVIADPAPTVRRLFVVQGQARSRIIAYDLDTLRVAEVAPKPDSIPVGYLGVVHAFDPKGHRLFLALQGDLIAVFDTTDIRARPTTFQGPSGVSSSQGGDQTGGLFYSTRDRLLYAFTAQPPHITAIDPDTGEDLWTVPLFPKCRLSQAGFSMWGQQVLGQSADGQYLYTLCRLGTAPQYALSGPAPVGVVRVTLPPDPREPASSYPIDLYPGITPGSRIADAVWIPASDRLAAVVGTNQGTGWTAFIFDGPTTSYVGSPALFQPSGSAVQYLETPTLGVDPGSGRIYAHAFAQASTGRRQNGVPCPTLVRNEFALVEAGPQSFGNAAIRYPSGDPHLFGSARGTAFDPIDRTFWMINRPVTEGDCSLEFPLEGGYTLAVYRDDASAGNQVLRDVDEATTDVAEVAGKTGANFGAQASAFGARYQVAPSGVEGPLTNVDIPSFGSLTCDPDTAYAPFWTNSGLAGVLDRPGAPPLPPQYTAFCRAGNREATFASVPAVSLDPQAAAAMAIAGETDQASAEDLETASDATHPGFYVNSVAGYVNGLGGDELPEQVPPPCEQQSDPSNPGSTSDSCQPLTGTPLGPYLSGAALPYPPASCIDSSGDMAEESQRVRPRAGEEEPLGETGPALASVLCSLSNTVARGRVYTNAPHAGTPVSAQDAAATAEVRRTGAEGTIATATSVVDGLNILGLIQIDRLEVRARVTAHGRPETNSVDYSCSVSGVRINVPEDSQLVLPEPMSCDDERLRSQAREINDQFAGILRLEFLPAPSDDEFADPFDAQVRSVRRTSPGGYLAEVSQSRIRQLENTVLLADQSIEHPAIVLTLYADSASQRDRFVATFGGVAARATYGIFLLPEVCPTCAASPPLPPPPPEVLGNVSVAGAASAPAKVPQDESPPSPIVRALQAVPRTLAFLVNNPGAILPLLAVWALLAWPLIVASRRRALRSVTEEAGE